MVSTNPLGTMLHEMYHWKDAQDYINEHGQLDMDYLENLRKKLKVKIDELARRGYDVAKVSRYAADAFNLGKYDEVYTEYRVHEALKRR